MQQGKQALKNYASENNALSCLSAPVENESRLNGVWEEFAASLMWKRRLNALSGKDANTPLSDILSDRDFNALSKAVAPLGIAISESRRGVIQNAVPNGVNPEIQYKTALALREGLQLNLDAYPDEAKRTLMDIYSILSKVTETPNDSAKIPEKLVPLAKYFVSEGIMDVDSCNQTQPVKPPSTPNQEIVPDSHSRHGLAGR